MQMLKRISQRIAANINHLLDQAEEPEVMIKQIIRDMEASIIELRRETVRAIAREKSLEKQILAAEDQVRTGAGKAEQALNAGNESLARQLVGKKVQAEKRQALLSRNLELAGATSGALKKDLNRLEEQVQSVRQKKEELIRRKRAAQARQSARNLRDRANQALKTFTISLKTLEDSARNLEDYEQAVSALECEVEAMEEL